MKKKLKLRVKKLEKKYQYFLSELKEFNELIKKSIVNINSRISR